LGCGREKMTIGNISEALTFLQHGLALDMPETSYQIALQLGIVQLHMARENAAHVFQHAALLAQNMIDKEPRLFQAHYVLALAYIGSAVSSPTWLDANNRPSMLTPGLSQLSIAKKIFAGDGFIRQVLLDLKQIERCGIEGLQDVHQAIGSDLSQLSES